MKKFYVHLTYMSMKQTQRVTIDALDAGDARRIALCKYPNCEINGPGAIYEVTDTGNCLAERN